MVMEENNNPPPQDAVKKLTQELENTKKLFQQKTAAADKLMSRSGDLEQQIIHLQTKVDEMTNTLAKAKVR